MVRVFLERRELPDDLRHLLDQNVAAAECTPPLDIIETGAALEVLLDVPGVSATEIDIVFARNVLLVTGYKQPALCGHSDAAFHIAERAFGRFGRAIKLEGAFDTGRASAVLAGGELRIVLPRQSERRGRLTRIPIRS
ncbi:MAG TPA: Hsp20/alpha crystallin family protein [Vicinamibacterales bacterium]|jgi:HSP20 family protein|nr:Hsp20/alpha crystallin family protein [Vicinamibacterales bacterium]